MVLGAKARAALAGRAEVQIEDLRAIAGPVLRHRIVTNYAAQAEGQTVDALVARLINEMPEYKEESANGRVQKILRS